MIVKFDLTSCYALNHMICPYFITRYLINQGSKDYLLENVEKRPVKLIANFVKFVKNKASQDNFPYDNISKSMTIATSIFWKDWDKVKTNQEKNEISHKNRARSKGIRDKWVSAQFKGYK